MKMLDDEYLLYRGRTGKLTVSRRDPVVNCRGFFLSSLPNAAYFYMQKDKQSVAGEDAALSILRLILHKHLEQTPNLPATFVQESVLSTSVQRFLNLLMVIEGLAKLTELITRDVQNVVDIEEWEWLQAAATNGFEAYFDPAYEIRMVKLSKWI